MVLLFMFLLGVLSSVIKAAVLTMMWEWFVFPLGAPELTFGYTLGILFAWELIGFSDTAGHKEPEIEDVFKSFIVHAVVSIMILGLGFAVNTIITW